MIAMVCGISVGCSKIFFFGSLNVYVFICQITTPTTNVDLFNDHS